jgi:hypothetical protein
LNLYQYLLRIKNNEAINVERFVDLLPKDLPGGYRWHHIFNHRKLAAKTYRVTINDNVAFTQLLIDSAPTDDRVMAAQQGDSHKMATSQSCLLIYHEQLTDRRPDTVLIDNDRLLQSFRPKKVLVIIENEENFFRYAEMLPLLSGFFGRTLDLSGCDIILGGGNRITKALNFRFLLQYHSVLCAFDLDFGGLSMFNTLKKGLQGSFTQQIELLMPRDFGPWLDAFCCQPKDADILRKALDLSAELGFVGLTDVFATRQRFMEQEVLLR